MTGDGTASAEAAHQADGEMVAALRRARRAAGALPQAASAAAALLAALGEVVTADASVVLAGGPLRCRYLAGTGDAATVDWGAEIEFADDAWTAAAPRQGHSARPGVAPRAAAILPLIGAYGTVALVVLLRSRSFRGSELAAAVPVVTASVPAVEVALLVDDLRSSAASEERRRLARETHDGVAQELATLGYRLDGLSGDAEARAPGMAGELRALRRDLSGVVRELRHAIGDLRVDIDRFGSLGGALTDSARAVTATAGIPVHLAVEESSTRLPAGMEMELLRIGQEALTNARRHSGAENIWLTCRISPPAALLRVDDDGSGPGRSRESDSFGVDIMFERAQQLGASLSIRERLPHGTRVEVIIGDRSGGARDTGD